MSLAEQGLADPRWPELLRRELDADPAWCSAARWWRGSFELRHDGGGLVVDVADGRVRDIFAAPAPHGSDVVVRAGDAAWARILAGELDLIGGVTLGEVELGGDVVQAMHEMRTLHFTLEAMRRVAGLVPPGPSPDPEPSAPEVVGRYVEVQGLRTYYEETGSGPPLVCIHAACQDTLMYRHVLAGLSDRFRVIALDAPGHGKTLVPEGGPFTDVTRHAEFNEAFMDALGIERPVLVGCSMGGNMVLELGARRPGGYRAIVSCEGAAHTPTIDQFTLEMLDANGAVLAEAFARSLTGPRTPPARAEEVVWQLCRATPAIMKADLAGYTAFDKRSVVGRIQDPVLLLRGDRDWLVTREMVEETAAGIAAARIVELEGTGHYPMIENPVEFNAAVRAFLAAALDSELTLTS
jgi:pimeloyl-ACP methyl ester carboxylesterase/putative sterol carrier protein